MIIPGMSGMFKLKENKSRPEDRAKNSRKLYDSALKVVEEISGLEPGEQDSVLEMVKIFLNDDRGRSMGQTMESVGDNLGISLLDVIGKNVNLGNERRSPDWVKEEMEKEEDK